LLQENKLIVHNENRFKQFVKVVANFLSYYGILNFHLKNLLYEKKLLLSLPAWLLNIHIRFFSTPDHRPAYSRRE
jgi:hypothetical protein